MARQNDFSRKFTQEDGFQVAFAVIDYGSDDFTDVKGRNLTDYLYPNVELIELNEEDQENPNPEPINMEYHICTDAELGLDGEGNSKFYPILED